MDEVLSTGYLAKADACGRGGIEVYYLSGQASSSARPAPALYGRIATARLVRAAA